MPDPPSPPPSSDVTPPLPHRTAFGFCPFPAACESPSCGILSQLFRRSRLWPRGLSEVSLLLAQSFVLQWTWGLAWFPETGPTPVGLAVIQSNRAVTHHLPKGTQGVTDGSTRTLPHAERTSANQRGTALTVSTAQLYLIYTCTFNSSGPQGSRSAWAPQLAPPAHQTLVPRSHDLMDTWLPPPPRALLPSRPSFTGTGGPSSSPVAFLRPFFTLGHCLSSKGYRALHQCSVAEYMPDTGEAPAPWAKWPGPLPKDARRSPLAKPQECGAAASPPAVSVTRVLCHPTLHVSPTCCLLPPRGVTHVGGQSAWEVCPCRAAQLVSGGRAPQEEHHEQRPSSIENVHVQRSGDPAGLCHMTTVQTS